MSTTFDPKATPVDRGSRPLLPITVGAVLGGAAVGCCSVGLSAGIAVALGVNTGFFAIGEASAVGDWPLFFFGALIVTLAVAWLVARRQTRDMPPEVARPAMRRVLVASAVAAAGSWFVIMQIVIPLAFVFGWLEMGQWFGPR